MTEELFKDKIGPNGGPKFSFMDMQLWMYFYGVVLNLTVFFVTNDGFTMGDFLHNMFRELGIAKELLFLKSTIPPRRIVAKMAHDDHWNHGDRSSRNGGGQVN